MKIYKFLNVFVIGLVIWLALTFPFSLPELYLGVIVSLIASLLAFPVLPEKPDVLNPKRWIGFIIYLPVFTWALIKANFNIAYIVLHPSLPVKPAIVRAQTELKGDMSRTMLANSITLTPGTLTVDVIDQDVFVHCVTMPKDCSENSDEAANARKEIVMPFESHIRRIAE